jgi:cation:H+ antiporter
LITLATFFIFADIDLKIGWVGVDSLIIILTYAAAVKLLRDTSMQERPSFSEEPGEDMPGMPVALIGFGLASLALVMVMPWLVTISHDIAEMSGLGDGFVGVALVAFISSLPELIATIAAVRMGVFDLAVGNLFGSNMFNMFALGLVDFFYTEGRFLAAISRDFVIVGFLGLVMTLLALQGNQARMERKFLFMEVDAFMLILVFIFGMLLIASRGIGV